MPKKEKIYLMLITLLGIGIIALSLLLLTADFSIPGLSPILSSVFWFFLWRLFILRGTISGGMWNFPYLIIIILNATAGISQLFTAIT